MQYPGPLLSRRYYNGTELQWSLRHPNIKGVPPQGLAYGRSAFRASRWTGQIERCHLHWLYTRRLHPAGGEQDRTGVSEPPEFRDQTGRLHREGCSERVLTRTMSPGGWLRSCNRRAYANSVGQISRVHAVLPSPRAARGRSSRCCG